jgi:hypothetical protein
MAGELVVLEQPQDFKPLAVQLPDEEPWLRLPDEPNRWFSRFDQFRLMGPNRSVLGAVKAEEAALGKRKQSERTPGSSAQASIRWHWKDRAESSDASELLKRHRQIDAEREESSKRHVYIARMIQAKGLEDWEEFKIGDDTSRDRLTWLTAGIATERVTLGEPSDIRQQQMTGGDGAPLKMYCGFNVADV